MNTIRSFLPQVSVPKRFGGCLAIVSSIPALAGREMQHETFQPARFETLTATQAV